MTHILFVHSAGAQRPGEGSSKLLASLRQTLPLGWTIEAPLMPAPEAPEPGPWQEAIMDAINATTGPLVIVGHSLGGSTTLQTLALNGVPKAVAGVVALAAPFWGAPDWTYLDYALTQDAGEKLAGLRLIILQGEDDETVARDHPQRYHSVLPQAEIRYLPGVDHEAATSAPHVFEAVRSITPA